VQSNGRIRICWPAELNQDFRIMSDPGLFRVLGYPG
jgi:hypothetical protein